MADKVVLEFSFKDDEDGYPRLSRIKRTHSDLTEDELDGLGEEIAQTDRWQVNHWNDIQKVLGGEVKTIKFEN